MITFAQIKAQASAIGSQAKASASRFADRELDRKDIALGAFALGGALTAVTNYILLDDINVVSPDGTTEEFSDITDAFERAGEIPGAFLEIEV